MRKPLTAEQARNLGIIDNILNASDLELGLPPPTITLRDWFAGMAMAEKMAHFGSMWSDETQRYELLEGVRRDGARLCYEIADAMMQARGEKP